MDSAGHRPPRPEEAHETRCAHCGARESDVPLRRCARCRSVRYCSVRCQKGDYARHKAACRSIGATQRRGSGGSTRQMKGDGDMSSKNDGRRFHPSFVGEGNLPQYTGDLPREELFELLMAGECFVWRKSGLLRGNSHGSGTQGEWSFDYLEEHLPSEEKYGGMVADDDANIFRFHKSSTHDAEEKEVGAKEDMKSKRTCFTFREFRSNPRAYLQMPLLWRNNIHCNGYKGPVGLRHHLVDFGQLSQLRLEPTVFAPFRVLQLFASHEGHLSYLHFDEQPNLFLQITGRKRWLLFPPEVDLHPYGPSSKHARRSSVDVLADPSDDHTELRGKGVEVLLEQGDALFIPSYWWHHVHTASVECVSIAVWFLNETLPLRPMAGDGYPRPLSLTRGQLVAQRRYLSSTAT